MEDTVSAQAQTCTAETELGLNTTTKATQETKPMHKTFSILNKRIHKGDILRINKHSLGVNCVHAIVTRDTFIELTVDS